MTAILCPVNSNLFSKYVLQEQHIANFRDPQSQLSLANKRKRLENVLDVQLAQDAQILGLKSTQRVGHVNSERVEPVLLQLSSALDGAPTGESHMSSNNTLPEKTNVKYNVKHCIHSSVAPSKVEVTRIVKADGDQIRQYKDETATLVSLPGHFRIDTLTKTNQKRLENSVQPQCVESDQYSTQNSSTESLEPFPSFQERCLPSTITGHSARMASPLMDPDYPDTRYWRRRRTSDTSSKFVHTIKTASISNGSVSIMRPSLDVDESNGGRASLKGRARSSVDHRRYTLDRTSDDEGARRGLRRGQIIAEIISTEEGYVADLKALAYLCSTLLTSATTISDNVRTVIQSNVKDILQIHQGILGKLRQVASQSAARKWADTVSPIRHSRVRRTKDFPSTSHSRSDSDTNQGARSSIDYVDIAQAGTVNILDVCLALTRALDEMDAYEEYCANHELILQELQKRVTSLWSTYESGIESLNRALVALSQRKFHGRKGLTVSDLLIKPIQRICRYPLLIEDLLKQTTLVDDPAAHEALSNVLARFRRIVQAVDTATDDQDVRIQIRQKRLLKDRLRFSEPSLDVCRALGNVQLCGVLHLTYETSSLKVKGVYAACVLYDDHLLITLPEAETNKLDVLILVALPDLKIEPAGSGKRLWAPFAMYTWRLSFSAGDETYEVLLSACSKIEEEQWKIGLQGGFRAPHFLHISTESTKSKVFRNLKPLGPIFRPQTPLSLKSSVQRSATVVDRPAACAVILRNTYNPQDLHAYRNGLSSSVTRSLSHAATRKDVVLVPRRAERTKLEVSLSEVYTKDRLPFPGMIASKGGQIIRASAGSLVRKLSFASMHASLSRRSTSSSSSKSSANLPASRKTTPTFTVRRRSLRRRTSDQACKPDDLPELETMDSLIERMINGDVKVTAEVVTSSLLSDKLGHQPEPHCLTLSQRRLDDLAIPRYKDGSGKAEPPRRFAKHNMRLDDAAAGQNRSVKYKRKRWSNPILKVRDFGGDVLRNRFYASKQHD